MLLTNFGNLNSVSSIFQEIHDFLVLMDLLIICIYLKTTNKHFRDQENVRHPASKLLKYDLIQTLITFWNPSLRTFAAGKVSLVYNLIYSGAKKNFVKLWNSKIFNLSRSIERYHFEELP